MAKYIIQKSEQKPNHWVCSDTENGIVCIFENAKFDDTQEVTLLNDVKGLDTYAIPRLMREMNDWLINNHHDKIF